MADITRDQYDETLLVQKKIFQKNRYVMDDELNALQDFLNHRLRRVFSELTEKDDVRFGTGFTVEGYANPNTVKVKLGACTAHVNEHHVVMPWIDADTLVSGWTTPSGSDRTDYLYLDIYEDEIDSMEDPDLINPARGEETTRDIRLVWSFEKSEGSAPGSPPEGHTYLSIAQIQRYDGVGVIQTSNITNLLPDHFAYPRLAVNNVFTGTNQFDAAVTLNEDVSVASGKTVDGQDISVWASEYQSLRDNYRETIFSAGHTVAHDDATAIPTTSYIFKVATDGNYYPIVNRWFTKTANIKYIKARIRYVWTGNVLNFKLEVDDTYSQNKDYAAGSGYLDFSVDVSAISNGETMKIDFEMKRTNANNLGYDLHIWAAYA